MTRLITKGLVLTTSFLAGDKGFAIGNNLRLLYKKRHHKSGRINEKLKNGDEMELWFTRQKSCVTNPLTADDHRLDRGGVQTGGGCWGQSVVS